MSTAARRPALPGPLRSRRPLPRRSGRGLALVSVMAVLVLCLSLVLATSRHTRFAELLVGNQSDRQRTQAAAEALLRDAEADILGRLPPYSTLQADGGRGRPCQPASSRPVAGCRPLDAQALWFPQSYRDFLELRSRLPAGTDTSGTAPCRQGICLSDRPGALGAVQDQLATLAPLGACYGQFTRAGHAIGSHAEHNPVLRADFDANNQCSNARAWYWVETFHYVSGAQSSTPATRYLVPDPQRSFVYRITVVAQGLREGTQVVLQSTFIPYPREAPP